MTPTTITGLLTLSVLLLASCSQGKEDNSQSTEAVAADSSENAAPELNSPVLVFPDLPLPDAFHRAYTMTESADGQLRLFTRETRDDTDIYQIEKQEDGSWSEPVKLDFPKLKSNTNPHFSPFDGRLYYATDNPRPGFEDRNDMNIWSVERLEDGWGTPVPVPGDVNTGSSETSVTTTPDGVMYFVSKNGRGQGGQDVYTATFNDAGGEWKFAFLPEQVNSPRVDTHVAVTPDGENIIFYSYRSPKLGVVDLVVASKTEDGGWTAPYNLGPEFNTKGIDFGAGMSADGKTFFFSREGQLMEASTDFLMEQIRLARQAYEEGREEEFLGLAPKS